MNYFAGTMNKVITLCICIFVCIQSDAWYEKIRGTLEGAVVKGQMSSDGTEYLWAKLLSDGLIINIIHYILYVIMFIISMKIIAIIFNNRSAFKVIKTFTRW